MRGVLIRYSIAIAAALLLGLVLRAWVLETFRVPGRVMAPSLAPGTMVVGFKFERWTKRSEPAIGDVLLFEATPPKSEESSIYIKRVMGLPGDTIEIRGGLVVRNGVAPAFDRSEKEPGCGIERHPDGLEIPVCLLPPVMETDQPVRVEPGSVFLVGDTRQRTVSNIPFGPVPVSSIISAAYRFCFQKPEGRASKFNSGCPLLKVY